LPEKNRNSTSNDYGNLPLNDHKSQSTAHFQHLSSRPLPELPSDSVNNVYDFVEIRNPHINLKREPPPPPPKPNRTSKAVMSPVQN
jgi:hypothetical protein